MDFVELWNGGNGGLMSDGSLCIMICSGPICYRSCLLNASVFLWNCGTVETGANV